MNPSINFDESRLFDEIDKDPRSVQFDLKLWVTLDVDRFTAWKEG